MKAVILLIPFVDALELGSSMLSKDSLKVGVTDSKFSLHVSAKFALDIGPRFSSQVEWNILSGPV